MNITRHWRKAAAAAIAIALVGAGAGAANAAAGDPVNPQPNGSKGSFFLFDGDANPAEQANRVYDRSEFLSSSASATDPGAVIFPKTYAPAWGNAVGDSIYKFVTTADALSQGTNGWLGYDFVPPSGPGTTKGIYYEDMTLEGKTQGNGAGIESVFSNGGDYVTGLAFTNAGGATVYASIYRTVHVEKGTGKYTIDPVTVESAPAPKTISESDLSGTPTGSAATTVDSSVVTIDAGAANANKTLKAAAYSTRVELGQVTLDGSGRGLIDVAGKGLSVGDQHKLFLYELTGSDETLRAWAPFTLTMTGPTSGGSSTSNLTVDVATSKRFELIAPANLNVDLGDVRRDQTTTAVKLGQFSVIDDRDELKGWNVNVSATSFTGPNGASIAAQALGYKPLVVGGVQNGVTLGAAKTAGSGSFGVLVSGAAGSTTTEAGAQFDTDLTFKAPVDAAKGTYNATMTLDLVSK